MRTFHYQVRCTTDLSFLKVKKNLQLTARRCSQHYSHWIGWFVDINFRLILASNDLCGERFWIIYIIIDERFLSVSLELSRRMKALWRLERFNLTILMPCFITLVFYSNKTCFFFYIINMTRFIRTLSMIPAPQCPYFNGIWLYY